MYVYYSEGYLGTSTVTEIVACIGYVIIVKLYIRISVTTQTLGREIVIVGTKS